MGRVGGGWSVFEKARGAKGPSCNRTDGQMDNLIRRGGFAASTEEEGQIGATVA